MELVLANFGKHIFLRIQSSYGGWWLATREDFNNVNGSGGSSLENFIQQSGQTKRKPLEVLARELMDGW